MSVPASLERRGDSVSDARDAAWKIPLSGFSLADLEGLHDPLPVVLKALRDAGLGLVAHAPLDKLKHPERAIEAVADAGLELARVTIEDVPNRPRSDVCRQVAAMRRKIRSFRAFAPLPRTLNLTQPTTGYQDVKRVALSRLLVGDVETIQVDWALYGPKAGPGGLIFEPTTSTRFPLTTTRFAGTPEIVTRRNSPQRSSRRIRADRAKCPLERRTDRPPGSRDADPPGCRQLSIPARS